MKDPTDAAHLELYLLRHAHAGNASEWTRDDALRPLSPKGRGQAERLGRHLAELGFQPDSIVSSPKLRALETAQLVGDALGLSVTTDDRLAGGVDVRAVADVVAGGNGSRVMLVGHDPDFSDLCADLVGAPAIPMKKGALARIDISRRLEPGTGTLRWLLPPDLVVAMLDR